MKTTILAAAIALSFTGQVTAEVLLDRGQAMEPASSNAIAITGPIIISKSHLTFEGGSTLQMELVAPDEVAAWSYGEEPIAADVYALSGESGILRNGNTLCGTDEADPAYVAVWKNNFMGLGENLYLSFFEESYSDPDLACSSLNYYCP